MVAGVAPGRGSGVWPRAKLHVGKLSHHRGALNGTQGFWKLCRGYLVLYGYEHAKVDIDLVYRAWSGNSLGGLSPRKTLKPVKITN